MIEVVVTTGAIGRAKIQSNHHQQTAVFLQAGCPSCRPTNSVKALKENITFHRLVYSKLTWGSSNVCLWPLIAPGYLGGCLPCLSSALWCQYPYCRLVEYSIKIVHCLPLEFS